MLVASISYIHGATADKSKLKNFIQMRHTLLWLKNNGGEKQ
jgi:hypothetical protein